MEGGIAGDGDWQPRWFLIRVLAVLSKAPRDRIASRGLRWFQEGPELVKIQVLLGQLGPLALPFLQVG
jgi:hypothetical protein